MSTINIDSLGLTDLIAMSLFAFLSILATVCLIIYFLYR